MPLSERDCTDVNGILLMLSATPDTSESEATGSVDGRAAGKSRDGSQPELDWSTDCTATSAFFTRASTQYYVLPSIKEGSAIRH